MHFQARQTITGLGAVFALALAACATDPAASVPLTPGERIAAVRPVSAAMLKQPAPGDWLVWGRTYDGQNFSPSRASTAPM